MDRDRDFFEKYTNLGNFWVNWLFFGNFDLLVTLFNDFELLAVKEWKEKENFAKKNNKNFRL